MSHLFRFDPASGDLVASGLLACDGALDTGEVAISIRGDYKGRGVGWGMLDLLAQEAQRRGVRRVISIESRENHAAIELEREKGFTPEACDDDPSVVILSKTFILFLLGPLFPLIIFVFAQRRK